MKLFLDLPTRQFVRSAASGAPLPRTFLKRRDKAQIEIVFVEKAAAVPIPAGTTFVTGLKTGFAATEFLALSDSTGLLDLYTTAVEELFANDPDTVTALLEVKTTSPGEETRTATLSVDLQNSVILGDEGSPAAQVSLKATSADATSGVSNEKWMTPLRTAEAIAALGGGSGGTAVNWSTLTGKPATFPPSSHTHPISEVTGLQTALNSKQPAGSYASATHTHDASAITSGTLSIDRIPVLPSQAPVVLNGLLASVTSAQEATIVTGTVVITSDGKRYVYKGTGAKTSADSYIVLADIAPSWASISEKPLAFAPAAHAHLVSEIAGLQGALDAKQQAGAYASAAQGAKADTASQPGHIHAKADITGLDSALATKITGAGVADMQVVTALPASPVATTFYIVIPTGASTASAVTLGNVSLLTSSGGGGGSSFTPASISGLQLWLDAADASTIFDATSGGLNFLADNSQVARWEDKSSNNRHLYQPITNARPVLKTGIKNGNNVIRFDGLNDLLSSSFQTILTPYTVVLVAYPKSDTGGYRVLFSGNNNLISAGYDNAAQVFLYTSTGFSSPRSKPTTFEIYFATVNGSNSKLAINENFNVSGSVTNQSMSSFALGTNTVSYFFQNDYAEVLIYNKALTDSEASELKIYLNQKWGITL
jgi:hypothetical protein